MFEMPFIHKHKKSAMLVLFVAGSLSALSFAPFHLWPIMGISLTILMRFLLGAQTKKEAVGYAFGYGFGLGLFSMGWLSNALLIEPGTFMAFIPFVYIGMGIFFGVFYAIPAFISMFASTPVRRVLCFTAAFCFFEWVRSWFLSGFPWNLTGMVLTGMPFLVQSAALWGVYGLSFLFLLLFCSAALGWRCKLFWSMLCVWILIGIGGAYRLYTASLDTVWGVQLRLVQPAIKQSLKWDPAAGEENLSRLINLSRAHNETITHVIWPESAVPFLIDQDEAQRLRLMSASRQGSTLITGGLRLAEKTPPRLSNSIYILDDLTDIQGVYDKSHLVPFGEYMPLSDIIPIQKVVPIPADFKAGDHVRTLLVPKAPPAGMLVCYEIIFSGQVVEKNNRPAWLINVTNDGWYGLSAGPYQHFDMAKMRAVEEGLPVVRAANNGISAVINPYGLPTAWLDLDKQGVLDAPLPVALKPTFYAQTGPLPLSLICFMLVIFSIARRK